MKKTILLTATTALLAVAPLMRADDKAKVDDRLNDADMVLRDMSHAADNGIPQDLKDKATCMVIVPGVKKAAFIIGGKYGRGFASCRKGGSWSAPAGVRVEGGSVGFQIGGSETDVIMLVMSQRGMSKLLEDKFTIGADASVAAGPVGRTASAETDAQLHAEILSYSRARGVFAGVALTGATLRPDHDTNKELYGHDMTNREILTGSVQAPPAASALMHDVGRPIDRDASHR